MTTAPDTPLFYQRSWVTQVTGDSRTVLLEDPTQQHFGPVELQTPVLRATLEQSGLGGGAAQIVCIAPVHAGAPGGGGILEPANPGAEEGVFA